METWLTSDSHFGHKNILSFLKADGSRLRDFDNVLEMNEHIIDNHNRVVAPDDKVYYLGDISMASFSFTKSIFDRLNGSKVLIKGNHDHFKYDQYSQIFKDTRACHIMDGILLAHIPVHPLMLSRWKGQVHGHLHDYVMDDNRYFNVCVERTNYTPINFEAIRRYFKDLTEPF